MKTGDESNGGTTNRPEFVSINDLLETVERMEGVLLDYRAEAAELRSEGRIQTADDVDRLVEEGFGKLTEVLRIAREQVERAKGDGSCGLT